MEKIRKVGRGRKEIFMGIDVHELTYQMSVFFEGEELLNSTYPSDVRHLKKLLQRDNGFDKYPAEHLCFSTKQLQSCLAFGRRKRLRCRKIVEV
jgi:hypothetical protein